MQIRLKYTIKISHFSIIIEKGNSKKKYKKVKIGYDKVKIKYRIKTRLPSKVKVFNFRGDQSPWSPPLDPPLVAMVASQLVSLRC